MEFACNCFENFVNSNPNIDFWYQRPKMLYNAKFQFFLWAKHIFFLKCHCTSAIFSQEPKKRTDLDLSLLYILMLSTNGKFTRENNFLTPSVCFRSSARALAAGLPRQDHVYKLLTNHFISRTKKIDEMRCKVDSTWNLRPFEEYPTTS